MISELVKEYCFEAAHRVPDEGEVGMRLHGHSYRVSIVVEGTVNEQLGWVIDFGDLTKAFAPIRAQLDHHYLNNIPGLEGGRMETIAVWIQERLKPQLPSLKAVYVSIVGDNAFVPVEVPADPVLGLPARIRFTFEAAQQLPHLPPNHPCRNLHGHTYRVEVASADLAQLDGPLHDLYNALDHRCLNDIEGLSEATSERLCAWIWERLARKVTGLHVVVVQETASARCIYHGR